MAGPSARGRVTSRANPLARAARDLLTSAGRRAQGAFLVEGVKLLGDALAAGVTPERVFLAPELVERRPGGLALRERLDPAVCVETSPELLGWLADTDTPQGVVAVVPLPPQRLPDEAGPLVLVLDGLQDPGNVGTILRSAVGSGQVRTVLVRGGADPFGPKAVRAAAGALFNLTVLRDDTALRPLLDGRAVWLADMTGDRLYNEVSWRGRVALVVGSEAHGATPGLRARAVGRVAVPLRGPIESLNAGIAASIILFEAARQAASSTDE